MADAANPDALFEMGMALLKAAGARVREGRGAELDVPATLRGSATARTQMQRQSRQSVIVSPSGTPYQIEGVGPENWFGPFEPMMPLADKPGPQGATGRRYDYPVGININFRPRAEEAITFATLRGLADNFDLLRLVIETRKDQIAAYDWEITAIDEENPDGAEGEIEQITEFLQQPDREHGWDEWARMLCEDILVVDGACIYPRKTRGGQPYSFELIDPATIKRLIDVEGRTPEPPSPAFQQVIKGVPAVDYSSDELVYWIRNKRSWKNYGYSPVEQVIVTVNIALRRQMYQLQYYTEGNLPDALIGVAETWTPEQIKEFQDYWDAMLSGVQANRRKVKFLPKWESLLSPRDSAVALSDAFDEWLARVICYAFSVPPIALVKMVNRAAGQQIADAAHEEGLVPFLRWFAARMNYLLRNYLGVKKCKFGWKMGEDVDAATQANIRASDVKAGIITIDEARDQIGHDPMGIKDLFVLTAAGPVPLKESLERARKDAINPPEPPAFGGGGFPPKPGAPGQPAQGGKPKTPQQDGDSKEPKQPAAEKVDVHVHMGDTIVRVPPQEAPDVNVNLGGVEIYGKEAPPAPKVVKKVVKAKRDPNTGELFGEVIETLEGGGNIIEKSVSTRQEVRS